MLLQIAFLGRNGQMRAHTAEENIVTAGCAETSSACKHDWLFRVDRNVKKIKIKRWKSKACLSVYVTHISSLSSMFGMGNLLRWRQSRESLKETGDCSFLFSLGS